MDMKEAKKHGFTETKTVKDVTFNTVLCIQLTMPLDSPTSSVIEHFKQKASEAIQTPVCKILRDGEIFCDKDSLLQLGVKDGDVLQFEEDCQVASEFVHPSDIGKLKRISVSSSRLDKLHEVRPRVEQAFQLDKKSQDDSSLAYYEGCEKIDDERHLHIGTLPSNAFLNRKPGGSTFTVLLQPKSADFMTMTLKFQDGATPRKCPLHVTDKHTVGDVRKHVATLVPCQAKGAIAIFSETARQQERSLSPQSKDRSHVQIRSTESSETEPKNNRQLVDLPNQSSVSSHNKVFCNGGMLYAEVEPLIKLKVCITFDDQEGVEEVYLEAYRFDAGDDLIQLIANKISLCPSQLDVYTGNDHRNPLVAEKSLNANGLHDGSLFYAVAHKTLCLDVHHVDELFKTTITIKDPWNTTIRTILGMTEEKHRLDTGVLRSEFDEEITLARLHFLKTHPLKVWSKKTSQSRTESSANETGRTTSFGSNSKPSLKCSEEQAAINQSTARNGASNSSRGVDLYYYGDPGHSSSQRTDSDSRHPVRDEVDNSTPSTPASLGPSHRPRVQANPVHDGNNREFESTERSGTRDSSLETTRPGESSPSLAAPADSHPAAPPPEPGQPPPSLLETPVPASHGRAGASTPSMDVVPYNPAPYLRGPDISAPPPWQSGGQELRDHPPIQHAASGQADMSSFLVRTVTSTCQQTEVRMPRHLMEQGLRAVTDIVRTGGPALPQQTSVVPATPRQNDALDTAIHHVAGSIGANDWRKLSSSLGLFMKDLEDINHQFPGDMFSQIRSGLYKWRQKVGSDATVQTLKSALIASERVDVAEQLRDDGVS